MNLELITKNDFVELKNELLEAIGKGFLAVSTKNKNDVPKLNQAYLKTREVLELLRISNGTLIKLREAGELNPSRVGGRWLYKRDEVLEYLERGKEGQLKNVLTHQLKAVRAKTK